jgi:pyruvate dehydrogenase E2 component (dihydrolipoamide acetyltransferase)
VFAEEAPSQYPSAVIPLSHPVKDGHILFASPLVRRLANKYGLKVESLTGTGPGGRIVRKDVESAAFSEPNPGVAPQGSLEVIPPDPARWQKSSAQSGP